MAFERNAFGIESGAPVTGRTLRRPDRRRRLGRAILTLLCGTAVGIAGAQTIPDIPRNHWLYEGFQRARRGGLLPVTGLALHPHVRALTEADATAMLLEAADTLERIAVDGINQRDVLASSMSQKARREAEAMFEDDRRFTLRDFRTYALLRRAADRLNGPLRSVGHTAISVRERIDYSLRCLARLRMPRAPAF